LVGIPSKLELVNIIRPVDGRFNLLNSQLSKLLNNINKEQFALQGFINDELLFRIENLNVVDFSRIFSDIINNGEVGDLFLKFH
jgi:hypothetical protein